MRGLLNVIQDYTWEDNSDDKVRIYTNVLHLLSAMTQETYIYHVDKGNMFVCSIMQFAVLLYLVNEDQCYPIFLSRSTYCGLK